MMERIATLTMIALALGANPARAEPRFVLRMAAVAPEGTAWTREIRAFADEVATGTGGDVRLKWYFGAVAGDELEVGDRIRRKQLDGAASGHMLCERIAPSMRVLRLLGLFHDRAESVHVLRVLGRKLDEEAAGSGFTMLATTILGPHVILSRTPVRNMAELRRLKHWRWDLDEVARTIEGEMGFQVVPLPLYDAARAYDQGRIDGFSALPSAALAFQWSAEASYLTDLRTDYLGGCLVVANSAFDRLPMEHQQTVRAAAAKLSIRFEELARLQDEQLLGGLFQRHGLKPVPVSDAFRAEFVAAAKSARDRLGERLVPKELLALVEATLESFRAAHRSAEGAKP